MLTLVRVAGTVAEPDPEVDEGASVAPELPEEDTEETAAVSEAVETTVESDCAVATAAKRPVTRMEKRILNFGYLGICTTREETIRYD